MQLTQQEMEQLDSGWRVVLVIWVSIFVFLGVYVVFCFFLGRNVTGNIGDKYPADMFRYAMYAISFVTLVSVYFLRKALLDTRKTTAPADSSTGQHPAVGKYTVAVIITSALLEGIAIFGVVLFLLINDATSLYLLIGISAASMLYFRPRREELIELARKMKRSR